MKLLPKMFSLPFKFAYNMPNQTTMCVGIQYKNNNNSSQTVLGYRYDA